MSNLYGFGRLAWNPDSHLRAHRRRVDADDVRRRPARRGRRSPASCWIVAGLRELLGAARHRHADGHHRRAFRPRRRVVRAQRLGTVASRGRQGRRDGSHGGDRHRLHRAIPAGGGARCTSRSRRARTNCCCSCTTCRTRTGCSRARRSSSTSTITHYLGAEQAAGFVSRWKTLEGLMDRERYLEVLDRLEFQAGHAIVWRDAVNNWFQRTSGILDEKGRVGREPGRVEAESLSLTGFTAVDVTPWETASGGKAVVCNSTAGCAAVYEYRDPPGSRDIVVQDRRSERRRVAVPVARRRQGDRPLDGRSQPAARRVERSHGDAANSARRGAEDRRPDSAGGDARRRVSQRRWTMLK